MTAEKGREKAEEVLGVLHDVAEDLPTEEAREAFWERVRLGVQDQPKLDTKAKREFWERMSPFIGGGARSSSDEIRAEAWRAVRRVWPNA